MLKSFTLKVFVSVLSAAFLAIAITVFFGIRTIGDGQELDIRNRMLSEASLAARLYTLNGNNAVAVLNALQHSNAEEGSVPLRLTITDASGRVTYDSSGTQNAENFDNHLDRPEIQQAIKFGFGYSMRDSGSLDTRYVYAAVTLEGGGVLRLAVPMESVKHDIWNRSGILLQVGFITVIISFIIAVLVSLSLKNSFLPMIGIVKEIAQGQLHRRILQIPGREFAPLATAVNSMATSIEEQVHSYADKTAQLETVLNSMSDGVLVMDPKGQIRRCNKAMERYFPEMAKSVGRQVVEVMPAPQVQIAIEGLLNEARCKNGTNQSVSMHLGLATGQVFSVFLSKPAKPDRRCGLVAVFHDVTDIMRLEQVRRDFVANVSHELRTPLTAICGYAETILSVKDKDKCRKFAEVILRNAYGLERMIKDLLDLSTLEKEGSSKKLEPVYVLDSANEALDICAGALKERNLSVECTIPEDCEVMADNIYLSQVFRNLIENASRYADKGSTVHITHRYDNGQVFLRVQNRGPLIPPQDLERIFERFYSVERHRGQAGTTGLGLSICRHILERYHGRIWAESPDSQGCTSFVFALERVKRAHDNAPDSEEA